MRVGVGCTGGGAVGDGVAAGTSGVMTGGVRVSCVTLTVTRFVGLGVWGVATAVETTLTVGAVRVPTAVALAVVGGAVGLTSATTLDVATDATVGCVARCAVAVGWGVFAGGDCTARRAKSSTMVPIASNAINRSSNRSAG